MPNKVLNFFFVLLWIFPAVITYFQIDSYSISTVMVILLFNMTYYVFAKQVRFYQFFLSNIVIIFTFILAHSFITGAIFQYNYDYMRNGISIIMLFIFILGAYNFSGILINLKDFFLRDIFKKLLYFYIFIIVVSFFTKSIPSIYGKPIFPYPEPSHLALFFGPVIGYLIISSKNVKQRIIYTFLGVIIALVIKNMTLFVTMLIITAFVYNIYAIPILIVGGLSLYFFADLEYYTSRLDFNNMQKTNNLSTLVYAKGFQLMEEGIKMSNGVGVGFQQLGHVPIKTEIGDYFIKILDGIDLNSNDGGFTCAKVVSEFGIFGLILMLCYIIFLIKQWMRFRRLDIYKITQQEALFFASIITIFSEFFFRGLGYFTATIFLFITVLFMKARINLKKNKWYNE